MPQDAAAPRDFQGIARVSNGVGKEKGPQQLLVTRGQMHHWRTLGPDIPRSVASPQSRTPFLRASTVYHLPAVLEARNTDDSRFAEDTPTEKFAGRP